MLETPQPILPSGFSMALSEHWSGDAQRNQKHNHQENLKIGQKLNRLSNFFNPISQLGSLRLWSVSNRDWADIVTSKETFRNFVRNFTCHSLIPALASK